MKTKNGGNGNKYQTMNIYINKINLKIIDINENILVKKVFKNNGSVLLCVDEIYQKVNNDCTSFE